MINQILLKNFKCFESLDLELKPLSVLMGLNGMGKSTLLQSLLLLRQSYQENQLSALKLNGKYVKLGNGSDILYERAEEEKISLNVKEEHCEIKTLFSYASGSDLLENLLHECAIPSDSVLFGNHFIYLSAYRIEPQDLYRIADEKELADRDFGNTGEYAIHYLNVYGNRTIENDSVIYNRTEDRSLNQQVKSWLSLIAPGILPQISVNTSLRNAELKYTFREGSENTNAYKSVNVGFGITYVLPIVIAILSAKPGDLLLLENPEAHIHPAGQRWLGELIAQACAGGVQILVETHSDHVLNGIRLTIKKAKLSHEKAGIFFFYKDEEDQYKHKTMLPSIDADGRIDIWPEGFLDEWDNALLELL